jgi:hypothetical protein
VVGRARILPGAERTLAFVHGLGERGKKQQWSWALPVSPPVPSSNWDRGPRSFKKTGDRRIVATALAAPKMAAPGGMRLALVNLVGLRNRLFAFLDVAEEVAADRLGKP